MDWKIFVAIGCVLLAFQDFSNVKLPDLNPPVVVVPVDKPSDNLVTLVEPLKAFKVDATDKHSLSSLFSAFADVVVQDQDVVKNNAQLREAVMVAGKFMFNGELGKKYPNLPETLNEILKKELGDNPQDFNKDKAVNLFKALSWAFHG